MINQVVELSSNLRAGRSRRGESSADDLKRMKTMFVCFLGILVSIFINYVNLKRKRSGRRISISALLACLIDISLLVCFPLQAIYPLVVLLSTGAMLHAQASGHQAEPRPAFLVIAILGSVTNALAFSQSPQSQEPSPFASNLFLLVFVFSFTTLVAKKIHRFLRFKAIICGVLSAFSAVAVAVTSADFSIPSLILAILIVILSRRTVALHLHQISPEYAASAIFAEIFSCKSLNVMSSSNDVSIVLSLVCGLAVLFILKPNTNHQPQPIATSSCAVRKKAYGDSDDWVAHVALPSDATNATTTRSSSGLVVVRSDQSTVDSIELDEDEDVLFRRITTTV